MSAAARIIEAQRMRIILQGGIQSISFNALFDVNEQERTLMNTNTLTALRFLYLYGPCYKTDFMKLLGKRGKPVYDRLSDRIRNEKGTEGFIEREIEAEGTKRQAHQTATIVALSPAGIVFYKDHEIRGLDRFTSSNTSLINTTQLKRILYPHLTEQKTFIMYRLVKVPCFTYDKPSLGYLVYVLSRNSLGLNRLPFRREYNDRHYETMSGEAKINTLKEFLRGGVFYSKKEVIEFLKLRGKNYTDSIKGLSWHGLFVSDTNMFINFVLSYGENARAYANSKMLGSLIAKLRDNIALATNICRHIPGISDSNNKIYENGIDAITIGIGSSHTYAEAMGNKFGLIKKRDMSLMASDARPFDVIDCTSSRFSRIYSIDDRELGIKMLRYITSHDLEGYHEEELEIFREDPRFSLNRYSNVFPADYTPLNVQAIYLPVYEIKLLKLIADRARKNYPVLVAARREMMETIAHSVHIESVDGLSSSKKKQPGLFFVEILEGEEEDDFHLGEFINEDSGVFNIYDQKGYIKGKRMIDEYLASRELKVKSEGEYMKIARLCSDKAPKDASDFEIRCRFYNAVARSSAEKYLDPHLKHMGDDLKSKILVEKLELRKKARTQHYNDRINISVTRRDLERIRLLANATSMKTSSLVRKTFMTILDETEKLSNEKGIDPDTALEQILERVHQNHSE